MDKFSVHEGILVPLVRDNVDTDQIMPKQFLKRVERTGFGEFVFNDWRFDANGDPSSDFTLNDARYERASVLLTGSNFGCGSSREHAPWGLADYGFSVIIAESFADIFYNNCCKIGLLPVSTTHRNILELENNCLAERDYTVRVSLKDQTVSDRHGFSFDFDIEPFRKHCLLEGLDDIGLTELHAEDIRKYEEKVSV